MQARVSGSLLLNGSKGKGFGMIVPNVKLLLSA
jgi:hypothetical protein